MAAIMYNAIDGIILARPRAPPPQHVLIIELAKNGAQASIGVAGVKQNS